MTKSASLINSKDAPHSQEAENGVLGSILIDSGSIAKALLKITPKDFYDPKNELIFSAMAEIHSEKSIPDLLTVAEKLSSSGNLKKVGGRAYLAQLTEDVPTSQHIDEYAKIVKEKSIMRRLISAATSVLSAESSDEMIGEIQKGISNASSLSPREFVNISSLAVDIKDDVFYPGIPVGYSALDKITNGFKGGQMITIGARPGMGKTTFALNIATKLSKRMNVAFLSLEMDRWEIMKKVVSSVSGISISEMENNWSYVKDSQDFKNALDKLSSANLFIDDMGGCSISDLRNAAIKMKVEKGIDVLVIDYLQLINPSGKTSSLNERISEVSKGIKQLAMELKIPVISLAQLSRSCDTRENKRPELSDLRDSGSIEQDSDKVLFIYRDSWYSKDTTDKSAEIIVRKNRQGNTGTCYMRADLELSTFSQIENSSSQRVFNPSTQKEDNAVQEIIDIDFNSDKW